MGFFVMLQGVEKLVPAEYWYRYGMYSMFFWATLYTIVNFNFS